MYPQSYRDVLAVPEDLEITAAAIVNHDEDWREDPLLERDESTLSKIYKWDIWVGRYAYTDHKHGNASKLGTIRATALSQNETEVVIQYTYTLYQYLGFGDVNMDRFQQYLDELIDTLVSRYNATGERVANPGKPHKEMIKVWRPGQSTGDEKAQSQDQDGQGVLDTDTQKPPWFPKTKEVIAKWKRSFVVILEIRQKYSELYNEGQTDDPNPSKEDFRDALAGMPDWKKKPSLSTVERITLAGDSGLLD